MQLISEKTESADVVIVGAGIAGISAAYHLAVKKGMRNIVMIDERDPLTLTSDKSMECYRNWWPGPHDYMVRFMNRSIDLMEELARETDNLIRLNRRGYLFMTREKDRIDQIRDTAAEISCLGAGPLRIHEDGSKTSDYLPSPAWSFENQVSGADLLLDSQIITKHYPYITHEVAAALHVRRGGWFSAQQMGMYMLEQILDHGVRILKSKVTGIVLKSGRVDSVDHQSIDQTYNIGTDVLVIAAGPFIDNITSMINVKLPVHNELHAKMAFQDYLGVVERDAPFMIWDDPVQLSWLPDERAELESDESTRWLLEEFPGGMHFRPDGGVDSPILLMQLSYGIDVVEPVWPPQFDPFVSDILLRGMIPMIPGLSRYIGRMRRPFVDGGYYCKTSDNRPLIGPLPVHGAFVIGAFAGYGLMASQAAGELLAAHVAGHRLPTYSEAFLVNRYEDSNYQEIVNQMQNNLGQL